MLKIRLRADIFKKYSSTLSIESAASEMEISYPTAFAMVKGNWNTLCFNMLGKYLALLGYTADELREAQFKTIFNIEETNEQEDLHPHS